METTWTVKDLGKIPYFCLHAYAHVGLVDSMITLFDETLKTKKFCQIMGMSIVMYLLVPSWIFSIENLIPCEKMEFHYDRMEYFTIRWRATQRQWEVWWQLKLAPLQFTRRPQTTGTKRARMVWVAFKPLERRSSCVCGFGFSVLAKRWLSPYFNAAYWGLVAFWTW